MSVVALAAVGGAIYLGFGRAQSVEPNEQQIYNYMRNHIDELGAGARVIEPREPGGKESLLLPVDKSKLGIPSSLDGYQNFAMYLHPSDKFPNFWSGRRCMLLNSEARTKSVQILIDYSDLSKSILDSLSFATIGNSITKASKDALSLGVDLITDAQNENEEEKERLVMLLGSPFNCDGTATDRFGIAGSGTIGDSYGLPAYVNSRKTVKLNIESYGEADPVFGPEVPAVNIMTIYACYSSYADQASRDKCVAGDPNFLPVTRPEPKTPIIDLPDYTPGTIPWDDSIYSLDKQRIQIALNNGVSADFLKAACDLFTNPVACKAYVDEQVKLLKPKPVIVFDAKYCISTGFSDSRCDRFNPLKGGNDGRWVQSNVDPSYYTNPAYPGRCVLKNGYGGFLVGQTGNNPADYDCNELARIRKCHNEFARLDPKKPETYANAVISPECGDQAYIRGAGQFVIAYLLNQTVPKGNIEGIKDNCTTLTGWAYSEANPSRPLYIDLYVDAFAGGRPPTFYKRVKANVQRNDLRQFGGEGYHALSFTMPNSLKDGKYHTVFAYALGIRSDGSLNGRNPLIGGVQFACDRPPQGSIDKIEIPKIGPYVVGCTVVGWAQDPSAPNSPLRVDLYFDNTSPGISIRANQYRQDLKDAGLGNGIHAFRVDVPRQWRDGKAHTVRAYGIGVNKYGQLNGQNELVGTKTFACY